MSSGTTAEYVAQLLQHELDNTDIAAICHARGLNEDQWIEQFFTEQGVIQALSTLSMQELIFLHFLKYRDCDVGIEMFFALYSVDLKATRSMTQAYELIYQSVKKNLLTNSKSKKCLLVDFVIRVGQRAVIKNVAR